MTAEVAPSDSAACYACGADLYGVDVALQEANLEGAAGMCLYCGALAVFAESGALARPTVEALDRLFDRPGFCAEWAAALHARQYSMLETGWRWLGHRGHRSS